MSQYKKLNSLDSIKFSILSDFNTNYMNYKTINYFSCYCKISLTFEIQRLTEKNSDKSVKYFYNFYKKMFSTYYVKNFQKFKKVSIKSEKSQNCLKISARLESIR